jgi:hypothetical protein
MKGLYLAEPLNHDLNKYATCMSENMKQMIADFKSRIGMELYLCYYCTRYARSRVPTSYLVWT